MQGKLNTIKNLAWALAIAVALLALLLALLFTAFSRYDGEMERPQVQLGAVKAAETGGSVSAPAGLDAALQESTGKLIKLAETADAGQGYIDSLTFLCDSSTVGLRDYGLLSGGIATTQVWGGVSGSLPIGSLADCVIYYPNDGSSISPSDAAMVSRPSILVICVGQDGLTDVTQEEFVSNYETLIRAIRAKSPQTLVVCCSIPSVAPGYAGTDKLTPDAISWGNDWVEQVCKETGAYFCDSARELRDNTNVLNERYAAANKKTLNTAGLNQLLLYLRTHKVP